MSDASQTAREWAEQFLYPRVHPVGYSPVMRKQVDTLTAALLDAKIEEAKRACHEYTINGLHQKICRQCRRVAQLEAERQAVGR